MARMLINSDTRGGGGYQGGAQGTETVTREKPYGCFIANSLYHTISTILLRVPSYPPVMLAGEHYPDRSGPAADRS